MLRKSKKVPRSNQYWYDRGFTKIGLRPKKKGDYSVPGSNYLGGGNPTDDGYAPTSDDDYKGYKHDLSEDYKTNEGYYKFGEDDQDFIDTIEGDTLTGTIGKKYFQVKKKLSDWGIISKLPKKPMSLRKRPQNWFVGGEGTDSHGNKVKFFDDPLKKMSRRGEVERLDEKPAPNVIPVDDGEGGDMVVSSAMRSAGATAGRTNGQETGVQYMPRSRLTPFDKTIQVLMPWYNSGTITLASGATSTSVGAISFRLNSIYDCKIETVSYSADPTPTAQTADATVNTPKFRAYWIQFYRYWTVVKSKYKIRFWEESASKDGEIEIYTYHHGQQGPPLVEHTSNTRITRDYRQMHPNMHMCKIQTKQDIVDGASGHRRSIFENKQNIRGIYRPGSVQHEVAEDELVENWHRTGEVPPLAENVTFILQRSQRALDTQYIIKYEIEFEYEVQLKDLAAQYEYFGATSAIPAIAAFTAQTN